MGIMFTFGHAVQMKIFIIIIKHHQDGIPLWTNIHISMFVVLHCNASYIWNNGVGYITQNMNIPTVAWEKQNRGLLITLYPDYSLRSIKIFGGPWEPEYNDDWYYGMHCYIYNIEKNKSSYGASENISREYRCLLDSL